MIRIGDRVKFISDSGSGIVRSVQGTIANVEMEDGFEIPVLINNIVSVTLEEEKRVADRIGYDEPKPKKNKSAEKTTDSQGRPIPKAQHFGRISLEGEYEDEDDIDIYTIKSNYLKQRASTVVAENKIEESEALLSPTDYDVKLCFVPHNAASPENSELSCWIVNDSSYNINYSIGRVVRGVVEPLASGAMEADSKITLSVLRRGELSELQTLRINISFFKKKAFVPQPTEDFMLDLHPLKFVRRGSFLENDFFDEPAVIYTLASNIALADAEKEVYEEPKPEVKEAPQEKKSYNRTEGDAEIIDLHVEEILDSTEGLSSGEILKAQIARFNIALDLALDNRRSGKLIFIHGIGGGKLKYEMKKILDKQYPRLRYQDASFREYGYGAMMIFLK